MSGLIYRRVLSHQWVKSEDQAERNAILARLDETLQKVGGRRLVLIECEASEALRQWDTLGMEIFPDMRAAQEYLKLLQETGQLQDIETTSVTGTSRDFEGWLMACH